MAEKTKCGSCKIFALCLNDPVRALESDDVRRCNNCEGHQAGSTYLHREDLCEEFLLESLRRIHHRPGFSFRCAECRKIKERFDKSQEKYVPAGRVGYTTPWMQGR